LLVHLPFFLLYLKGEVLLGDVTEADYNNGRQDLGDRGVDMELFYKQLNEDNVQTDADQHQHKVPEQLDPAVQGAAGKGDMPVEKETGGKAYTKSDEHGRYIRRDGREAQMHKVLVEDIIEAEPVHHDVQHRTRATTCRVPKGLQGHDPAKGRIKEIDKRRDIVFQLLHHICSRGDK
jgi:hypothetical protein